LGFYGVEAHPLIAELARLKLAQPPSAMPPLEDVASQMVKEASRLAARRLGRTRPAAATQPVLVQRCFSSEHLELLVAIRDVIRKRQDDPAAAYLKWALLGSLRELASAKVGWPYQRPGKQRRPLFGEPEKRFVARARLIQEDLAKFSDETKSTPASVICGDARSADSWHDLAPSGADGCVSSPPYLNNFDYADATRLELYFWGEVTSWSQMCATVRSGMLTATTQQSSVPAASKAQDSLTSFTDTAEHIRSLTSALEEQRKSRERGKEYDRVVPDYFAGIWEVLKHLASRLKPTAPCVWLIGDSAPYGVYIDTPAIIGDLAQQVGFRLEADVVLRHRGKRWSSNATRHDVQLTERLILFRRRS
jgi:hypothetical protein